MATRSEGSSGKRHKCHETPKGSLVSSVFRGGGDFGVLVTSLDRRISVDVGGGGRGKAVAGSEVLPKGV